MIKKKINIWLLVQSSANQSEIKEKSRPRSPIVHPFFVWMVYIQHKIKNVNFTCWGANALV